MFWKLNNNILEVIWLVLAQETRGMVNDNSTPSESFDISDLLRTFQVKIIIEHLNMLTEKLLFQKCFTQKAHLRWAMTGV